MFRRFNRKQVFILSLLSVILCVERSIGSSVQDRQARWKPRNPHEAFPVLGRRGPPNGEGKAGGGRRKGGGRGEGVNSVPPHPEFYQHTVITPKVFHSRSKRSLHHTRQQDGVHVGGITLAFNTGEEDIVVDLSLNKELLTKNYFEKYIHNGSQVVHRPYAEEVDMCHYQGSIRGRADSWVAVSTCNGLSGVLYDGEDVHYIERIPSASNSLHTPHYLLHHAHLRSRNHSCGYTSKSHPVQDLFHDEAVTRLLRYKRSSRSSGIRGPYNSNSDSRYVELVLVADKSEYQKHGHEVSKIYQRCKDIANIVNALYQPLNIFIALVGVEVWKDDDQVEISTNGDTTLTNFLNYRKVRLIREYPNDNAQLLTGKVFDAGVVGKALKGPICTYQYSGGVNMDHSDTVGLVATTVAHEMGHNFGMEHDTEDECKCPKKRCIMAPSSGTKSPTHWSSCSHEYLALSFERSMDYCLRNKPTSIFDSPICGNGFVEPGEQCDCGLPEYCTNPCCNATTCMLFNNATCATGHCCDLQTCRPRPAGYECRPSVHECDLDEYCSGDSEYCPDDVHKEDGHECSRGKAYCFRGMCRTHEEQCRLLWGPTGKSSDDRCYKMNTQGNQNGNCGYNWVNDTYYKCIDEDVRCGMVHCMHLNERLEFGMESVSKVSHSFLRGKKGVVIPCRVALVDMGLDMKDPGLVPDGAKCGNGKMCVNQKCLPVADLKVSPCPYSCHGNGVCNSLGHCHCHVGYAPPYCQYPGLGGSQDSGPASNPHATKTFVVGLYVFFLGIVPLTVLLLCLLFYSRGTLKEWWEKKGRPATSKIPHVDGRKREAGHRQTDMSSPVSMNGTARSPTPPSSQGSKSNSPLLNGHAKTITDGPTPGKFSSKFFGKHEGFTLTPIKDDQGLPTYSQAIASTTNTPAFGPTAPALPVAPVPPRPPPASTLKVERTLDCVSKTSVIAPVKAKSISAPNDSVIAVKPQISEPSLQTSTNPDLAKPVIRPAPLPPPPAPAPPYTTTHTGGMIGSNSAGSQSAMRGEVALRKAPSPPTRPLSVPDATLLHRSASVNPTSTSGNSGTVGKASAVARLASFLSKKDRMDGPQNQPNTVLEQELSRSNTLSRKAAKINRESLMQLEISAPMQLQATELPANLVPVRSAPDPPVPAGIQSGPNKDDQPRPGKVSWAASVPKEKASEVGQQQSAWIPLAKSDAQAHLELTRMGSLREPSVTVRPPIPKFGSLRAPRPKSLPPTRPSEPPPRPPLPAIPGTPENDYLYDDCLNVQDVAPLAAEEVSPSESIYATIDEKTPEAGLEEVTFAPADENSDRKGKKSLFSFLYTKPKKKKKEDKSVTEPVYCNVTTDPSTSSSSSPSLSPPTSNPDRTSVESSEDGGLLSEIVSELSHRESGYENTLSKRKKKTSDASSIKPTSITDKGIEGTDSVLKSQSNSITHTPSGGASWPANKLKPEFSSRPLTTTASPTSSHTSTITTCSPTTSTSPVCVTTSSPKSATARSTTCTEPRGVFSYLKKSSSAGSEVSSARSSVHSSASFSHAKPTPGVHTVSSNPKSLDASLAAVRAAGAAAGKAAAAAVTKADDKKTLLTRGDASSKKVEALRSNFGSGSSTKPFSATTTTTTATITTSASSHSTTTTSTSTPTVTTPAVQTSNITSTIPSTSAPKPRPAFPPDKIIFPPDKVLTSSGSRKGDNKGMMKNPEGAKGAKASSTAPSKVTSSGGKVTSPGSKGVSSGPVSKVTSPGSKVTSGKGGKATSTPGSKVAAGPKATSPQGSKTASSSLGSKTSSNLSSSSSSSKASSASLRGTTPSRTSTGKADRSLSATPTSSTSSASNEEPSNNKSRAGVSSKKTVTRTEVATKEKVLPPDKGSSTKAVEKQSITTAGNADNHPGIKKGNKLSGSSVGNKVNSSKLVSPSKPLGSVSSSRNPSFSATTGTVAAMQQKFEKKDVEKEEDMSKKKSGKSTLKGQTVKSTKPSVAPKPK